MPKKNVWHKQECEQNGCDYKRGLLYLIWMVNIQMLPCPQLIFPSKFTWFFGIYLNYQQQKSLKNQYLPPSESKSYQINSIKSCSSRSFQEHQIMFQFLWNFQLWFNLIYSEKIIQYSKTFAPQVETSRNQAHAPLLAKSFPKTPRTQSEASQFGGSHKYKTNCLPSYWIDRPFST